MSAHATVVFTDGAAKGNPGPGGWGVVILTTDGQVLELGGGASPTTNNRMELTGAIQALTRLRETPGPLAVYTDSTYVINGIREWIWGWRKRGWKTASGGDYWKINPKGYVPALELDDGQVLTEVAVICQYLADQKPESRLAPRFGTMERYREMEWLNFASSEVHKQIGALFNPKLTPEMKEVQLGAPTHPSISIIR